MDRQTLKMMREEQILSSLDKLGFASRSQLQQIHNLGSIRNTNRILKNMAPYLNYFNDVERIYYLNKKGAERIGSEKLLTKNRNYKHALMSNDLYINFGQPKTWKQEATIEVPDKLIIRMDAYFYDRMGRPVFVEIDNIQKMIENMKKLEHYKQLKDLKVLQKKYGYFPVIVWLTTTKYRKDKILKKADALGLKTDIYLIDDMV